MKLIQTAELIGYPLDWAVAKCEFEIVSILKGAVCGFQRGTGKSVDFKPTTDWCQGGPILERELIETTPSNRMATPNDKWTASKVVMVTGDARALYSDGPTMLIAGLRCYVASRLGTEIQVPRALFN